jgi:hypothetical protein
MKRIGITTIYYKTVNYGGALQAYALCKILNSNGFDSKQLSIGNSTIIKKQTKIKRVIRFPLRVVRRIYMMIFMPKKLAKIRWLKRENARTKPAQEKAFNNFLDNIIPHDEKVYNSNTVANCLNDYDVFITGSDQIWNLDWFNPSYFLDFVPSSRKKIAYAASIGHSSLKDSEKELFKNYLTDFSAISVREKDAVDLVQPLVSVNIDITLDPTLLLDRKDWQEICSERVKKDNYIFCYFLGENSRERKLAEEYAKIKGLKLLAMVCTHGNMYVDKTFNAEKLEGISPEQFLSLIKNAEYVFTDSFHAVVFSNVFERQYFVFNRDEKGSMNSRIFNITELFNSSDRFCFNSERENIEYISSLPNIDYGIENKKFQEMKEKSIRFLLENVK